VAGGRLLVCATPIGNLGDVSGRLRNALASADIVFAEDTRRTAKLLRHLVINVDMVSLFAGNEQSRVTRVIDEISSGSTVVLVSDAGMPTVSDPGATVIRAVREAGFPISVVPGPSAVTAAVALSGFGANRFVFEGFLPRKGSARTERLKRISWEESPVVLFASPNRLVEDLTDLAAACGGERQVVVARELTKLHEESWVGTLADAVVRWSRPLKGEVTLVLGPTKPDRPDPDGAIELARRMAQGGTSVRETARAVSEQTGVSRRVIYEALLADQELS
jgi:16S rRNA (cytidine1402-2'-O)-methyltransferase